MEAQGEGHVQMQQSEKPDLGTGFLSTDLGAAGGFVVAASDLSWRNALVLTPGSSAKAFPFPKTKGSHVLERICRSLPFPAYLDADTNAFVDIFCATLIVDAKLEGITVFELERARVLVGR